jgi:hypothetical protein
MTTTREPLAPLAFSSDASYALTMTAARRMQARREMSRHETPHRTVWLCDRKRVAHSVECAFAALQRFGYVEVPGFGRTEFHSLPILTESGAELLERWQAAATTSR